MAGISSARNCCFRSLLDYDESLAECCSCKRSMNDPVLLSCLHSCCRSCAEPDSSEQQPMISSSTAMKCPACGDATDRSSVISNGLLYNYQRRSTLSSEVVYCKTCDAQDVAALFWCADCCSALCDSCYWWHKKFTRRHRTAELDVARTWSLSQLMPSAAQCSTHRRQMDVQCFTCGVPRCSRCYETCRDGKHDAQPLSNVEIRKHISAQILAIRQQKERLHRIMPRLRRKCSDVTSRLQRAHRNDGRELLEQRQCSLYGATVNAFDTCVGAVCVNLQRIWEMCTTTMGKRVKLRETAILAAGNIEMLSVERLPTLNLLRERHLVKDAVIRCISEHCESLRCRRTYWMENGAFGIDGSSPLTSDIVLRSCLGATNRRRAAPPAPLHFRQASVTFRTPVACYGLAVTRYGHVLMAALAHGLLVFSDSGQQLSNWRPEGRSYGRDSVTCVAALSDGRAAVGVAHARLVVLLRLSDTGFTWLEDRRVAVLQFPSYRLAVHGDLLAAAEGRRDEQQQPQILGWVPGRKVKLLRLSSGQLLYTLSKDYNINIVALTALCLITTSWDPVKRNSGATPCVLDAFSHSGEFVWRFESSDSELLDGLCVSDDTRSLVYMTLVSSDESSCRVIAIRGADGRDRREVMNSVTHGLQPSAYLSLARGQQRTILAGLSFDVAVGQYRFVSLYKAS